MREREREKYRKSRKVKMRDERGKRELETRGWE